MRTLIVILALVATIAAATAATGFWVKAGAGAGPCPSGTNYSCQLVVIGVI
jgi:hypothetical protein